MDLIRVPREFMSPRTELKRDPQRVPAGAGFSVHTGEFLSFRTVPGIRRSSNMMLFSETPRMGVRPGRHLGSHLRDGWE